MSRLFTVFVNTSDGFEDCWGPFFTLWSRYARALAGAPLLLNTERKSYAFNHLDVETTQVAIGSTLNHSWSECLLRGLAQVTTPYVLYFQEDYFLKRDVCGAVVAKAIQCLEESEAVVCYLNQWGPQWKHADESAGFLSIPYEAKYLLSTQAAVWRVDALRALVREWENGWAFEKFGTLRMRRARLSALQWTGDSAVDYTYTGVIKGQWLPECVELFAKESITVNFAKRGFYKQNGQLKTRFEVAQKLLSSPLGFLQSCWSVWGH